MLSVRLVLCDEQLFREFVRFLAQQERYEVGDVQQSLRRF
jgi:hypothetical protein